MPLSPWPCGIARAVPVLFVFVSNLINVRLERLKETAAAALRRGWCGTAGGRNQRSRSEETEGPKRAAQAEAARRRGFPGARSGARAGRAEAAMLSRAGIRARPGLGLLQVRGVRAGGPGTGEVPVRGMPTWGRSG